MTEKRLCDICGLEYLTELRDFNGYFTPIYKDSMVRVRVSSRDDSTVTIATFDTCSNCASDILNYIHSRRRRNDQ